jgi:GTP-binding protein EngB required for normal cell division
LTRTTPGRDKPQSGAPQALAAIDALGEGIAAARILELDVARAAAVAQEASERLGIAPDAYVVALVGGTGVGKSTILNALAGEDVSPAGARRPTTGEPVAWVAAEAVDEVRPLLARLGVESSRTHAKPELRRVVILDLPDVDSLEAGHRATVEELLPKIDVVAWVTDPEKYADAVLHDAFLRDWMARLDRQIVVLNKADRLEAGALANVKRDLEGLVARTIPATGWRERVGGLARDREVGRVPRAAPAVITASAIGGEAGIAELKAWLADAAEAKAVVAARLTAAARAALLELTSEAGVSSAVAGPLVPAVEQRRAIDAAVEEVLRVVDLPGAERQAVAATRARARRRGTGPIGLLTSAIYRFSGRQGRAANPTAFLRGWRDRGGLTRGAEVVRRAVVDALPGVPPALRGRYAAAAEGRDLERRFEDALDRVVARQAEIEAPSSRLWPVIGLLQTANTLLLVFAVAWVVLWVIARPEVANYNLPLLGPVPAPMVLLFVGLATGYVLARLLSLHAGWLGRRWARRVSKELRDAIKDIIAADAFAPIDRIEAARSSLAAAWRRATEG